MPRVQLVEGLTQTQAADLLGMPQPKLSNLLRGRFRGVTAV
jgi:predicted XRE-type DNA-binding protein